MSEKMRERVKRSPLLLMNASDELKDDKELVLTAVSKDGVALREASSRLRKDRDVVLAAVKQNPLALDFALNEDLRDDEEIAIEAIKRNGRALYYLSSRLRNNKMIVLLAALNNLESLIYVGEELRSSAIDYAEVLSLLMERFFGDEKSKRIISDYTPTRLKSSKLCLLETLRYIPKSLLLVDETLLNDKDIVLTAVKGDGELLKYVGDKFKNDPEIVLAAIKSNYKAIEYVGKELINERSAYMKILEKGLNRYFSTSEKEWILSKLPSELKNNTPLIIKIFSKNKINRR